jgi:hypothetical protein
VRVPVFLFWTLTLGKTFTLLSGLIFLIIYGIIVVITFFAPLFLIHLKLKERKSDEINKCLSNIDYNRLNLINSDKTQINDYILKLQLLKTVTGMKECPFNFEKTIIQIAIPVISVLINIPYLLFK